MISSSPKLFCASRRGPRHAAVLRRICALVISLQRARRPSQRTSTRGRERGLPESTRWRSSGGRAHTGTAVPPSIPTATHLRSPLRVNIPRLHERVAVSEIDNVHPSHPSMLSCGPARSGALEPAASHFSTVPPRGGAVAQR